MFKLYIKTNNVDTLREVHKYLYKRDDTRMLETNYDGQNYYLGLMTFDKETRNYLAQEIVLTFKVEVF